MESKNSSQQIQTPTPLLRPPSFCNDLPTSASTDSMERASRHHRNTEDREFEKERKRVRYVSAGLSAIFTFLFVVVLVSTIGLHWWYSLVICGTPVLFGGLLLLRRHYKDAERRRLEIETEMASDQSPVFVMPYSTLLYEHCMQQLAIQNCTQCQHCEQPSNNVPSPQNAANNCTNNACLCENLPPAYSVLYPTGGNSLPAAT